MSVASRPTRPGHGSLPLPHAVAAAAIVVALVSLACTAAGAVPGAASPSPASPPAAGGTVRLYTSASQPTVEAVTAALADVEPGITLEVFRAPTGELAARIAAEERGGRILADVLWLTDPLSIQGYAERGLLMSWTPAGAANLDPALVEEAFWGTRILNMIIVHGSDVDPAPRAWRDLTAETYRDAIAIPNPSFAGSAFGALGAFTQLPDFGIEYYRALKANGTTQLNAPDEVTTGVAEGRFAAGMTLDFSARSAIDKGSPIELVWPDEGSIAIYGPIGVVDATEEPEAARAFVEFVLSEAGQAAIASTGFEPALPGVGGPEPGGEQVHPDWSEAFGRQQELLDAYQSIVGG